MTASTKIHSQTQMLHTCRMVVDSNSHHSMSNTLTLPDTPDNLISEALIPQVRTIATLIAAERHDFNQSSPSVFTDEADFFAARILVLGVRRFHLDITLLPMLKTANKRAEAFAKRHHMPFSPAEMQMSLHTRRPANLLIIETEHEMPTLAIWPPTAVHLPRNFPILFCKTT